jgi:hypothetical protein
MTQVVPPRSSFLVIFWYVDVVLIIVHGPTEVIAY